jgi:predicted O-linked N-acetylglucosamine transferase (SPINDLY family)
LDIRHSTFDIPQRMTVNPVATIPETLAVALQYHQAGRPAEAEALYRQILEAEPSHPEALHLLGLLVHQRGQHDIAVRLIQQAIASSPHIANYHNNIGEAYRALGKLAEAVGHYHRALALQPDLAEAHNNLGIVLKDQGQLEGAMAHYQRALELKPACAEAHNNLGTVYQTQGKLDKAADEYAKALALKPNFAEAHNSLGTILHAQGKLLEAVAHYRQALALRPAYGEAYNNLGVALQEQGQPEEAVAHYRQALALERANAEACYNLGNLHRDQGQPKEAVGYYRQALKHKPGYPEAENQLMHQLQCLCDWSGLDELFQRQRQLPETSPTEMLAPFSLLSIPSSPAQQLTCARNWVGARLAPVARLRDGLGFHFTRVAKPRLRIGYLSAEFRQHPVAYLVPELFALHDRTRFEVVVYSYGPEDGSEIRRRIAHGCDQFVDLRAASFEEAARRIYADGVDILVDLMGYTRHARTQILALRPAPIQVSYLGYLGTMGAEFMDYIITDRFITPPDREPFFTEKFVYLPDCYQVSDRRRPMAPTTPTRRECGLPTSAIVFCCFNNSYKISPDTFSIWMRLLTAVPGSVLWLVEAGGSAAANLCREAQVRGVKPERLVFAQRMPMGYYLARLPLADLFLDTVPYNAGATASDALWAGLPLLTCAGETFASRVAGSLLTAIGLPELITYSLEDYEARALQLATHPTELAALRERLEKNRLTAPLFDTPRFTRHLEMAYRMMWEIYLGGEPPRQIEVPSLPAGP